MWVTALSIDDEGVVKGEIALALVPGTIARDQARALDDAAGPALHETAGSSGAVLAAAPSRFCQPLPGKDESGRTRYAVRGRLEGGRLVPDRGGRK